MRISAKGMSITYFVMGMLFTYIAAQTANNTVWNTTTIILAVIAALQFGGAIKLMTIHIRVKRHKKK